MVMMTVWFGVTVFFLFFWMIGLLTELQRSETIDLQKLMHLPVELGQMFTVNYIVSHFSLSIILVVPVMLGLGIGLAISRGPEMILLVPLALSMVLMITAWTYCLRGWLATTMSNPRRRRTVIMGISLAFVLIAQGPNLYFNVFQNRNALHGSHEERPQQREVRDTATKQMIDNLVAAQGFVPPLWMPVGARALAEGNPLPALLGTLGCLGIATLGLRRAYRSTVRFYHGDTGGRAAVKISGEAKKTSIPRDKSKTDFLERSIPFVPEQSAALALATLRSLLRAPEVKMAWATSFIVTIILGATFFFRATMNLSEAIKPFFATGSAVFPVFFLAQFFNNQFGFDRDGFRSLILSPADRRLILIGKNLAGLPVGLVVQRAAHHADRCAAAPAVTDDFGDAVSVRQRAVDGGCRRQSAFHPRPLPHPARLDEADQTARPRDAGADVLPDAFSPGDGAGLRRPASGVALAPVGSPGFGAGQSHIVGAALLPDGAPLLADARAAGPPAPTARNKNSRRDRGGS